VEERRRYFRLDDEVILDFETITHEEAHQWKVKHVQHQSELAELERDISSILAQLQSQNPAITKVLDLLNRKVNLLVSPLGNKNTDKEISQTEMRTRVNLSACGMAFHSKEPMAENENLRVQMQLKPSNAPVSLIGTVVGVEASDNIDAPYLVRVNFEGLREAEQELLIHHLFQLQSRALRERNQAQNDAE